MVNYSDWLKDIDSDTYISKLSLPGTHNSAACHAALPSVRCQDHSVSSQLQHGVRFFDIRLGKLFFNKNEDGKYDSNELQVIHGKFPVRIPFPLKFSSVLQEFYEFLDQHPGETVVVSLKQEGEDSWDNDNDEFGKFFWNNYIHRDNNAFEKYWYLKNEVPRLGDARGKIILFRRFGTREQDYGNEYGINAAWWSYNTTSEDRGAFQVQDYCEINGTNDIVQKASYVKSLMKSASEFNSTNPDSSKLFINFCSGSNFFNKDCWPEKISEKIRQCGLEEEIRKGCGVVIIDYAGSDDWRLVERIVSSNF